MIKAILARLQQKHRTIKYPYASPPDMPDRFRGLPVLDSANCSPGCRMCIDVCPSEAITEGLKIDLGLCLFCGACAQTCPSSAISFSRDYRLSVRNRKHLVMDNIALHMAGALDKKSKSLFGRSLKLRQVSAGGCNACEADTNVLNTIGWDVGRFGIQFVASPRHADGLLITGPVSNNMRLALEKTYTAVPSPKLVIAVGACAISGGPYANHPEVQNGANPVVPVDLYIPGCPPHPLTILDGMLRLIGKV